MFMVTALALAIQFSTRFTSSRHARDKDCTHFCFTIGPFDAGLERLGLIIAEAVSIRGAAVVPDPAPEKLVC